MLHLDARSTFINVLRKLLLRNLCFAGTDGEAGKHMQSWINKQLDRSMMSLESGKIFGKIQLQMAQSSQLGVQLSKNLIISAIGQANETLLKSLITFIDYRTSVKYFFTTVQSSIWLKLTRTHMAYAQFRTFLAQNRTFSFQNWP